MTRHELLRALMGGQVPPARFRDPEFLREPDHRWRRSELTEPPRGDRSRWGNRVFVAGAAYAGPRPTMVRNNATLIDTPHYDTPQSFAIRLRFSSPAFANQGEPTEWLETTTDPVFIGDVSLYFNMRRGLDLTGPVAYDRVRVRSHNATTPDNVPTIPPVNQRWPLPIVQATQLGLDIDFEATVAESPAAALWVEAIATLITDQNRHELRADIGDVGPGYPNALVTRVDVDDASTVLLAANDRRTHFIIVNEHPSETLYVKFGNGVSFTDYTLTIPPSATSVKFAYEALHPVYRGLISAILTGEASSGQAQVTEGYV